MKTMEVWTLENGKAVCTEFEGDESRNKANEYFLIKRKSGLPIITRCSETYDDTPYDDYHLKSNKIRFWDTKWEDWFLPIIELDRRGWEDDVIGDILYNVFDLFANLWDEFKIKRFVDFTFNGVNLTVWEEFHHGDWDEEGKHYEILFSKDGKPLSSFGISC